MARETRECDVMPSVKDSGESYGEQDKSTSLWKF